MSKLGFGGTLLIAFWLLMLEQEIEDLSIEEGSFEVGETEAEDRIGWFSSQPVSARPFNPFSVNYWLSVPSQFLQYWFPLFQPPYRPPNLPKPSTPRPAVDNQTNQTEKDKGKDNIFGMPDSPGDSVEYLPPAGEIEW